MSKPSPAYFWATDSREVLALSCLQTYFCSSSFKVRDGEVQSHLSPASLTKPYRGPQVVWSVNIRLPSNSNFREIATLARYSATRHYTSKFHEEKNIAISEKNIAILEHKLSNDPSLREERKTTMFHLSSPFFPQSTLDVGSCLIQQSLHLLNRLHHLRWGLHIYSPTEDTLCSTEKGIFCFLNAFMWMCLRAFSVIILICVYRCACYVLPCEFFLLL